jgi:hypothetical protein
MRTALLLFLIVLGGCTSYRREVPIETVPAATEARARYQVWSHGEDRILWSVRIGADTVSGVPYWRDPACDSCRIAIPRPEVDSIRAKGFDGNKSLAFAILMTPVVLAAILVSAMSGPNY